MIALSVFFLNEDELAKAVLLADTTLVERELTLGAMKNKTDRPKDLADLLRLGYSPFSELLIDCGRS